MSERIAINYHNKPLRFIQYNSGDLKFNFKFQKELSQSFYNDF